MYCTTTVHFKSVFSDTVQQKCFHAAVLLREREIFDLFFIQDMLVYRNQIIRVVSADDDRSTRHRVEQFYILAAHFFTPHRLHERSISVNGTVRVILAGVLCSEQNIQRSLGDMRKYQIS